ncbi:AMP-binding protein [Conexibacter stalactiti]|uniref:AMP-binding protein n=1 Tax=Conexibacter stalactiti TaxID=1940611 RepID=A0ABU4HY51_9ACTN|nr:AMP-binding protein [Conexibacter stalactiti]MDW5597622.1 AMP-binding protein [Conexibacter stalactiti]MEC5038264.1 AMP-binding protein [Conexibacter stalactiti]
MTNLSVVDQVGLRTVNDLLRERADSHGDKDFLVFEDADGAVVRFTYARWQREVEALAAGLASRGVREGMKVALRMRNRPELLMSWFALARLGAVTVLTITQNTARETHYVTSYSDAEMVITEAEFLELYMELLPELPAVRTLVVLGAAAPPPGVVRFEDVPLHDGRAPQVRLAPDAPIQMLFTSGTTAAPKAVVLTHANCLHAGEREWMIQGLDPSDRLLTCLPFFHVNAQTITLLSTLTLGATATFLQTYSASRFIDQLRRHRATQTSMSSAIVRTLLAQPERPDDAEHELRRVFYALNVTDAEKAAFEQRFGVELMNAYGLTEAMTVVSVTPVFGDRRWPSVGRPAVERLVRIVGEDGEPVPVGEVGEITVFGRPGFTLMQGYYKNQEATDAAIRDGWLHTGDLGRLDADGYLFYVDRVKDMIKRSGENVSAAEVEGVLMAHPAIAEVAVIGVPDAIRDEAVKAFVVTVPGAQLTVEEVTDHCRERLAAFKVPTVVEFPAELPHTSVGKVEKKALRLRETAAR